MPKLKTALTGVGVIGAVVALAGGLALWKYRQISAPPPPPFEMFEAVEVVDAKTVMWRPEAQLVGTVFALQSVTLSNEVAGTVREVKFDSGQVVEAGSVLLTLDATTERAELSAFEAAIAAAEANVRVVESDIALAETRVQRMRQAVENKAAPEMDMDEARAALVSSTAQRDRMKAEIETAKARAEQTRTIIAKKTLTAPFKARVGIRSVHPGQYLQEGAEIAMLQSVDDRIYVDFAVPQEYLARVTPGMTVMAKASVFGDEPVKIEVVAIDAAANRDTRNVRLRSIVDNPGERLRPGMFVDVQVPVDQAKPFIAVPSTAVRRAPFGDHVFVIVPKEAGGAAPGSAPGAASTGTPESTSGGAGGGPPAPTLKAVQRFVRTGPAIGTDVIILEGLKPEERVAAAGSFKLRDGVAVMASDPKPPVLQPPGSVTSADAAESGTAAR